MLRSAISAFTRVFDALCLAAWCAADPGPMKVSLCVWVPALRHFAPRRVRDTRHYFSRRAFATCAGVTNGAALPQELRM
jgi:hypothetical protein